MPTPRHCNTGRTYSRLSTARYHKRTQFAIYTVHVVQKITIIMCAEIGKYAV